MKANVCQQEESVLVDHPRSLEDISRELMALRIANEIPDGTYVNLGIGIPTLVSNWIEGRDILFEAELGTLNTGPLATPDEEDQDLSMQAVSLSVKCPAPPISQWRILLP